MLNIRLVRKLLGILTLILWGFGAVSGIYAAIEELPSWQVAWTIIGILLPLFIPLLLLSSEGFYRKHPRFTTISGWIWGVIAALGGLILLLFLPVKFMVAGWGSSEGEAYFSIVIWIGVMLLLLADAVILFIRVSRRR